MKVRRMGHVRPYALSLRNGPPPRQSGEAKQKRLRAISHAQVVVHPDEVAIESTGERAHRDVCPDDLFVVRRGN